MAADANNDGIADLFVGNYTSETVAILLGNGAGGFGAPTTLSVGGRPWMVAAGDVDGDGNVDVVTCNSNAASGSIARGNGLGGFLGTAVNYPAGSFPLAVELGDLEGDGDLDLALSNFSSGTFTLYRNNGAGVFGSPTTLPALTAGSCSAFVDDDRDGDVDFVGIDEIDDRVFLFRQTGPSPAGVQPPTCAATLRIDNLANRGGFGGAPAHDVPIGGIFFVGVTGGPSLPYALAVGLPLEPGLATGFGIVNVVNWFLLLDGFAGNPIAFTNGFGEDVEAIPVPALFPPGFSVVLQAIVADPGNPLGGTLTNPERIVLVP